MKDRKTTAPWFNVSTPECFHTLEIDLVKVWEGSSIMMELLVVIVFEYPLLFIRGSNMGCMVWCLIWVWTDCL